jgi:hypothetical protein
MEETPTPLNQNPNPEPEQPQVNTQTSQGIVVGGSDTAENIQDTGPIANPSEQNISQKPSKWRHLFIVLGVLQVLGILVFLLAMLALASEAGAGVSGTEFAAIALFVTLVPAVGIVALINLIGLPIYLVKKKLHGKGRVFGLLSLTVSALLVIYVAVGLIETFVIARMDDASFSKQLKHDQAARNQQFAADNAKPEITKDEAIQLLKTCQLSGFYYTNQNSKDGGEWGDLSTTGVVLTKIDGKPYRISVADRLVPELEPIAREAQKTCGGPQFWHDGRYEQRQPDGTWK